MLVTKDKYETINKKFSKLNLPFMCYDIVMKAIFIDEVNILAKMISDVTGIDYKLLEDNVILEVNELPVSIKNEKAKRCDFILKIDKNNILNLEINTSYYPELVIKNLSYLFNIYSRTAKKNEKYNKNILIRQLNLNCYDDNLDKPLSKYTLLEEETHMLYSKSIAIFDLNVVKCNDVYYNLSNKEVIPNYIRWGALIYNRDFKKISEIAEGIMTGEEVRQIMDKIESLIDDSLFMSDLETLEMYRKEEDAIRDYGEQLARERGHAEGLAEGRAEGLAEGQKELILSMVKNGATLEFISKVTNKTIDEIKEIIKE